MHVWLRVKGQHSAVYTFIQWSRALTSVFPGVISEQILIIEAIFEVYKGVSATPICRFVAPRAQALEVLESC